MPITFHVESFEGPLDLLLQLVEKNELDISTVSLARVAEQFVEHVQASKDIAPEDLADFLVVAAKLMYLKSKLLIPALHDEELEEGPDLETQLREYRRFVEASRQINEIWNGGLRSFARQARPQKIAAGFVPPIGVTIEILHLAMRRVIARLEPLLKLPETSLARAISIQDKIHDLFHRVKTHAKTTFRAFLAHTKDKTEAIVSFLALLELVKQRFVQVEQGSLFHDISIAKHPTAPEADPLAESFV